jgi:hypothetical protein
MSAPPRGAPGVVGPGVYRLPTDEGCVTRKMGVMPNAIGGKMRKTLSMLEAVDRWENEGGTVSPNDPTETTSGLRPTNGDRGSSVRVTGSEPLPPHSSSSSGQIRRPEVS